MNDYTTYQLSKKEKRDFLFVSGVGVFTASYLFYHSIILSLAFLCILPLMLPKYAEYLAKKRSRILKTQFKDLLYSLSSSFAAGRQMAEALREAPKDIALVYGEDAPMVKELTFIVKSIFDGHKREDELLADFAARSGIEDIRSFIDVYIAGRSTGADIGKVITRTAEDLTDKMNIEREIETITAQKRFEGKLISAMPLAIILILNLLSPDYLDVLYSSIQGRLIMTGSLAVMGYAYYLMMRLTDINV